MNRPRNYWVYFEFLGKKQKIRILAESESEAIEELRSRLMIVKSVPDKTNDFNAAMDMMDDFMSRITKK